ncbi:MAG TPA: cyclic nucleotide-binding domain-containing protein [Azospirillaceae bacterium]|nr:cyclic nucleotide-binding domain-containing protein [Azospirillaceae bacterium]
MAEHYRIAIVGSGPGGISAAARAASLGVPHILLERTDHLSDTIYKYQKRKHVMAHPMQLPLRSDVGFQEGAREDILGAATDGISRAKANVRFKAEVTAITGERGAFTLQLANGDAITAEFVILAIGCQGNLRKLSVPGDDWERVQYQLDDPDEYKNEKIVVIGGGDAGIENALALMPNNDVTIVNNGPEFAYAKPANAAMVKEAIKTGNMTGFMGSSAKSVRPGTLTLNTPDGEVEVPCDRIIARIGALPPRKFVESCGVQFPSPAPSAFPQVSETYESNVPGLYIIGALAGYPLIKQCMNQGYEVVEFIQGNRIPPADEPLLQEKLDKARVDLTVTELVELIRQRLPVFAKLTTLQVREMLLATEVHVKRPGETVFQRNDYTNTFWAIVDGAVDIQVNPLNPKEVVTLRSGDFFGEMGLISGRRRTSTVVSKEPSLLIEVARNTMIRLNNSVPEVKRAIDEVAIVRQIQTYLAPKVNKDILADVIGKAEIVAFKKGDPLIEQGNDDDCMYLIRSGSVVVSRKEAGRETVLSYVPAGNYVGEMALLNKAKRSASVKAAVATEAIRLDSGAMRDLLERMPDVRRQVEATLRARTLSNVDREEHREVGGMTEFLMKQGLGEATDVLLIDESLCVRCDNCEKACAETHHGVSRLNREAGPTFANVHVPTSCRHCEHPHCMKDCPADAIHRASTGEVYITDNCIGCGNCERNCPYGVIQLAAVPPEKPSLWQWLFFGRGHGPGEDKSPDALAKRTGGKHAVKCDMCKELDGGPACVRACPTGAALRVSPREFLEVMNRVA